MRALPKALCLIAALALPAAGHAALAVGAKAPPVRTRASLAGKDFDFVLAKALKKGPVVLYFFPKTFTEGCTIEAHAFSEATGEFAKMGATVIGMSADTIGDLNRFSTEACRNQFAVGIATPAMIKGYDVALTTANPAMAGRSSRISYLIAPDGKILFVHSDKDAKSHITATLAALKGWKAAH